MGSTLREHPGFPYITAITDFKEEVLEKEKQVLQLQMKMNRTFVKVDELAVEEILKPTGRTCRRYIPESLLISGTSRW